MAKAMWPLTRDSASMRWGAAVLLPSSRTGIFRVRGRAPTGLPIERGCCRRDDRGLTISRIAGQRFAAAAELVAEGDEIQWGDPAWRRRWFTTSAWDKGSAPATGSVPMPRP